MRPTSRQCLPRRTAIERSRRPRERLPVYSALTRILPLERLTSCSSRRVASTAWQSPAREAVRYEVSSIAWMPMMRTRSMPPRPSPGTLASSVSPSSTCVTLPVHTWQCAPCG